MLDRLSVMPYSAVMASRNNHRRPMSQPERSFWRDVFTTRATFDPLDVSVERAVEACADFADKAVEEYRKRITWRQS